MKAQYVAGLAEGDAVDSVFALRSKEVRCARTGDAYLSVELADRTGSLAGVKFRPGRDDLAVPVGSAVVVRGRVTAWKGARRVSVEALRPADGFAREDLLPGGTKDQGEMLSRLRELVRAVQSPPLRAVLRAVFGDKPFMARFLACPASQTHHHAHIGGLLEHTVSVASHCHSLAGCYDPVDVDLLVTAALLHDVGKVDELTYDTSVAYTDAGRLLGHVVLGERRVRDAAATLGDAVPDSLMLRLSHVIVSHHGELEWGAPKRPATLEALLLHHVDNLDAKTTGFIEASSGAALAEEAWTDAYNLFRRPLYAPRPAEDDRTWPIQEDASYACAGR